MLVPLQGAAAGAAAGCCLKVNGVGALEWHAGKMWSTKNEHTHMSWKMWRAQKKIKTVNVLF